MTMPTWVLSDAFRAWVSPSSDGTKVSLAAAPCSPGLCSAIQTPSGTSAVPTARFQLIRSSTNATPSTTATTGAR